MIRKPSIARPLFALAALVIAAPLAARGPVVVTGEPQPSYQERVDFADLDLRQSKARQTLVRRVRGAAERVCTEAEGPISSPGVAWGRDGGMTCAEKTHAHAHPQILAAINRAKAGQPQLATALVITGPALAR